MTSSSVNEAKQLRHPDERSEEACLPAGRDLNKKYIEILRRLRWPSDSQAPQNDEVFRGSQNDGSFLDSVIPNAVSEGS